MRITCRAQDFEVFKELGFHEEYSPLPGFIEAVDCDADSAHNGNLPTNIPYRGYSEAGCEYGACQYACDGKKLYEACGTDNNFTVNYRPGRGFNKKDMRVIERFVAADKLVRDMFKRQTETDNKGSVKLAKQVAANPFHEVQIR